MSGDHNFSFLDLLGHISKIGEVIDSGLIEVVDDRIFIFFFFGQPAFLDNVGPSDQFGSKFQFFILGQLNLEVPSGNGPFEVVLNSWYDICLIFVISLLQLLRNRLNGLLNIALLGVHQNSEVILVLKIPSKIHQQRDHRLG